MTAIMGIQKSWQATYCFRTFRNKTHDLSKVYWIQQLGADYLAQALPQLAPDAYTAKELPCSFQFKMYPATVYETLDWLPTYMSRNRLHLLVVYTAFLESYLKEMCLLHLASQGYMENSTELDKPIKLNPVGKALGAPILRSSTVPDMLRYVESLLKIDLGSHASKWIHIYHLRCEVAHNGGLASADLSRKLSGFPLAHGTQQHEMLGLSWDELRGFMRSGDEMAATIDTRISSYAFTLAEVDQALRQMWASGHKPPRQRLWNALFAQYGLKVKRKDKAVFEHKYYGVS